MRQELEVINDVAEDVTNHRPKQQQNSDNHDSNQNQDKGVLYEALTFFAGKE
jgi:hypothetical protein